MAALTWAQMAMPRMPMGAAVAAEEVVQTPVSSGDQARGEQTATSSSSLPNGATLIAPGSDALREPTRSRASSRLAKRISRESTRQLSRSELEAGPVAGCSSGAAPRIGTS